MSNDVRQAIADAANSAGGDIHVAPYFRQSTRPGDGMVRLDRLFPDSSGIGQMCVWQVVIILSTVQADAERWMDTYLGGLVEAVSTELVVTGAQPVSLALDTGTLPALIVTGNRGQE